MRKITRWCTQHCRIALLLTAESVYIKGDLLFVVILWRPNKKDRLFIYNQTYKYIYIKDIFLNDKLWANNYSQENVFIHIGKKTVNLVNKCFNT